VNSTKIIRIGGVALCTLVTGVLLAQTSTDGVPPETEAVESFVVTEAWSARRDGELRRQVKDDLARRKWERARQSLEELVTHRDYNADYHVTLGLVYRELGDLTEARRKYRDFLGCAGSPALASLLLAESYARDQRMDEAMKNLEKAAAQGMNVMRAARQFPALAALTKDTQFIRLALRLEAYELEEEREFRDPFTPRASSQLTEATTSAPASRWSREYQEGIVQQAGERLRSIEYALNKGDEDSAMGFYVQLLELLENSDRVVEADLAVEVRGIEERLGEIEDLIRSLKLDYLYGIARELIDSMELSFRDRDFPEVDRTRGEVERICGQMEAADSSFREVAETVRVVADQWVEKARVWREFGVLGVSIQGIVKSDDGNFAIVGGRTVRVGDQVVGCVVEQIDANQVWFSFQGERIAVVFRRY